MAGYGEEGGVDGLSWFDAAVVKLSVKDKRRFKIPHLGWNRCRQTKSSTLNAGIPDNSEFYFMHSYHWKTLHQEYISGETEYETVFPASVERENIFGVQYHPEKSHQVGEKLLRNFVEL